MLVRKFLDPKNDVAFRKIFGTEKNKDILIHFLNDVLGFQHDNAIQTVEFLSTIQDPEIASKKESIVDVLCKDCKGTQYIIEMQVSPSQGFEKRAQYYAAKAYTRQADKGQEETGKYHNLKEIIFIAIANTILFPEKEHYKSDHVILDKNSHEHDLKDFYFTFIELPKFKKDKVEDLSNILEKWCYFFKYASITTPENWEKIIESDQVIKRAYEALDQFYWSEPELLAYEKETKRVWDNQAVWDYAVDAAEKKGIEKGKAEIAQKMLAKNIAVAEIAEMTGLSAEEINAIDRKEPPTPLIS